MSSGSRTRIGVLNRPYGLAGGIRLALDGDAVPTIAVPCDAWSGYSEAYLQQTRLERYEVRGNDLICYFAGIVNRDQAAPLLDRAIFVPVDALSYEQPLANPLLIGYEVRNDSEETLGRIVSIFKTPAHYIWSVATDAHEWMVPAIDEFVLAVRHDDRVVVVRPIPGMIVEEQEHGES